MTDREAGLNPSDVVLHGRSKAERVADVLAARIQEDKLEPGAFLGTKSQLRDQFRVSPATMDMALHLLIDRGAVEARPGVKGGVRVAGQPGTVSLGRARWLLRASGTDAKQAGQALGVYFGLQPQIVAAAVHGQTAQDRKALRAVCHRLRKANGDQQEYFAAHEAAHDALLEATHDDVLISVVRNLLAIADQATEGQRAPGVQLPADEDPAVYVADRAEVHIRIIEAVLRRDVEDAWHGLLHHAVTQADLPADAAILSAGFLDLQTYWQRMVGGPH
ncbi:MAG TPA: FCD domain-containing protein [Amycolatopsis sp.]|uniref:FadR/GntR family transcriptional regulator n=1 Tax=Amycolatopsis sp. TaxID=37632 RepID=UPI002B45A2B0|nr:FCD domain-containing protein [Amycolatopsis sp.]HKS47483.1 FCD domain-containing protein [Amycolatopsis sp.]